MPSYTVTGPSGKTYTIDGPEGATADQLGQVILANSHEERAAVELAKEKVEYNPTNDMGMGSRFLAGIGAGMSHVGRALGQLLPGGPNQSDVDEAKRLEAPLQATTAGKVGNAVGTAAALAPVAFVPGANTYAGAAGIGAVTGALTTEGGVADRAKGAVGGAAGGVVGLGIGRGIGAAAQAGKNALAKAAANDAGRSANVVAAQDAGYVLPPVQIKPDLKNALVQAVAGPIKTTQAAAATNQGTTNRLAAEALGIPEGTPITTDVLDAVRAEAGGAYSEVAKMGKFNAAGADLPAIANVKTGYDRMTMTPKAEVDAADLVSAWKQSSADASAYFRQYARDANPETLAKAKASAADAKTVDDFLVKVVSRREGKSLDQLAADLAKGRITAEEFTTDALRNALSQNGRPSAVDALKSARVQIAKSYDVERALKGNNVDAATLAALARKNPGRLSGELATIAKTGNDFPKATRLLTEEPSPYSAVDAMGALYSSFHNPLAIAAIAARPGLRSAALSQPGQAIARMQPGPTTANALLLAAQNPGLRKTLTVGGMGTGSNLLATYGQQ